MPIYEYECPECGYRISRLEPMDSIHEIPCTNPEKLKNGDFCYGFAKRIPSVPGPPVFKCSMPTYRKGQ